MSKIVQLKDAETGENIYPIGTTSMEGEVPEHTHDASEMGIADYIVEQGTEGIWTYRKWASGIAECWGHLRVVLSHYAQNNFLYAYSSATDLPFTFAEIPAKTFNAQVGSGAAMPMSATLGDTTSQISWHAYANSSGEQTCTVSFNVKGRWK